MLRDAARRVIIGLTFPKEQPAKQVTAAPSTIMLQQHCKQLHNKSTSLNQMPCQSTCFTIIQSTCSQLIACRLQALPSLQAQTAVAAGQPVLLQAIAYRLRQLQLLLLLLLTCCLLLFDFWVCCVWYFCGHLLSDLFSYSLIQLILFYCTLEYRLQILMWLLLHRQYPHSDFSPSDLSHYYAPI